MKSRREIRSQSEKQRKSGSCLQFIQWRPQARASETSQRLVDGKVVVQTEGRGHRRLGDLADPHVQPLAQAEVVGRGPFDPFRARRPADGPGQLGNTTRESRTNALNNRRCRPGVVPGNLRARRGCNRLPRVTGWHPASGLSHERALLLFLTQSDGRGHVRVIVVGHQRADSAGRPHRSILRRSGG